MNGWNCDNCGHRITNAEDGWIEWISFINKKPGRGLRLVHHVPASPYATQGGCQYETRHEHAIDGGLVSDGSLESYLGPDGLTKLLALLYDNELEKFEILEMIMRLHIPGYEDARAHFERAKAEFVVEPNMPPGFYWQYQIKDTIQMAQRYVDAENQ